jgi:hypothetical protein
MFCYLFTKYNQNGKNISYIRHLWIGGHIQWGLACVAALGESRACTKPPTLPYLLVLSEDEKSDWFKMKQIC